jgi:hypothetical protein
MVLLRLEAVPGYWVLQEHAILIFEISLRSCSHGGVRDVGMKVGWCRGSTLLIGKSASGHVSCQWQDVQDPSRG